MDSNMREEQRKIFRKELFTLREEGYLSEAIVDTVARAHYQYHMDLLEMEAKPPSSENNTPIKKAAPPKPQKVKKTLTPEEIRERNITWLLNIGVIFLLIGGLFVATSNWESMTSFMKSGSIAIVALLFYGIAFLTKKILKIEKTAFAFSVLGSLFLPIFILSLGWFGLLGPYLSISGEGRYLLGTLGSLLPIIVYYVFAKNLVSRLFVWFTYVSISIGTAFLLASFHLKIDFFYLGLMVFNAIFIFVYHQLKHKESFKLFTNEFIPYVQVNLVLCTLFMLFLYDNEVLYSFNLLLTAIIYLSMMYVSGRKEYHFIFSVMIVYGAYQLIEHSFLDSFGAIVYALIGFGIVFVPKAMDDKFTLNKAFQYTSAVISGLAFIYISLEGILLRAGNPSIVLMLAYFIIAVNFIYLSSQGSRRLFPYLSAVFGASGIYETIALVCRPFDMVNFSLQLSLAGFILYFGLGIALLSKYVMIIQTASRDVGLSIMVLAILSAIFWLLWWEIGVMLLLLVVAAFLLYKKETRIYLQEAALWSLPGLLGLSIVAFGEEINTNFSVYLNEYGYAINFAAGAIMVLLFSFVWKKVGEKELGIISIYTSQVLYTFAIFHALLSPINHLWVQPLVLLVGIGMYFYLYKKVGTKWVPFIVSISVLLTYFSIIQAITLKFSLSHTINSLIASTSAVVMLLIAYLSQKNDLNLSIAFAWVGHSIYPLALIFTWFAYQSDSIYSFILGMFVYAFSTKFTKVEWKIKVFLYGSFTSLYFIVSTGLDQLINRYFGNYEFPITSGFILLFAFFTKDEFKKRTAYYFVPFSTIGIVFTLITYPFDLLPYLVTLAYIVGTLFYMHKIKWDLLGVIPLFLAFIATIEYSYLSELDDLDKMLLSGGLGIVLLIIGQFVYKKLVEYGPNIQQTKFDGFTLVSFMFFFLMYSFENQYIWCQALPGLLISASFLLQRKRVPARFSVLLTILGGAYLLQPYYSIMAMLHIPSLWEREVIVLPFIILIIFIRRCLKGSYSDITKVVQWGVLIIVSLLLIQDGLASNTIYDAIILGTLSLLAMMAGMFLQIKSYFFVGAGVLLLNVFLQTRPYWGNMPWWFYLLIAGLILITVASFNEWNKQKVNKGESTFITSFKEKVIDKMKKWD
ncbi:hypothetical protein HFZ78_24945 [Priestia megaterium]|uniref:DUF2157 domain-containing protein n=1 Tax=Priestia megaterium TaxID=1404 RepID=A0A6H1P7K6_PRIMG|nr:hypothetical protein [Priestia megaterium]QIZ09523.1 hypothetical protein HFZ78_24945 [Priestia megaterium]